MRISWQKRTKEDVFVDVICYLFCAIFLFVTVYPFFYTLLVSLNEGTDTARGGMYWWPRAFTLENYRGFLKNEKWARGFMVTTARTVLGTVLCVLFTSLVSYGLSFKDLMYRKLYMTIVIVCMYFSGGIIPYYVVLRTLQLTNTFWVYVVPGAMNTFFLLTGLNFFSDIPPALRESAKIDGAGEVTIFRKIILPVSMPFLATLALFSGVGHWNAWSDSAFFVKDSNLRTLPYLMMEVIRKATISADQTKIQTEGLNRTTQTSLSIQAAAMMITIIPIVCVYPWLQRYFVTGLTIGSVKE